MFKYMPILLICSIGEFTASPDCVGEAGRAAVLFARSWSQCTSRGWGWNLALFEPYQDTLPAGKCLLRHWDDLKSNTSYMSAVWLNFFKKYAALVLNIHLKKAVRNVVQGMFMHKEDLLVYCIAYCRDIFSCCVNFNNQWISNAEKMIEMRNNLHLPIT